MAVRTRYYTTVILAVVVFTLYYHLSTQGYHWRKQDEQAVKISSRPSPSPSPSPEEPYPRYKPIRGTPIPIEDNFPSLAKASSAAELPPVPEWNVPPNPHVTEKTPLFIGFTTNWLMLQQAVVSYIASGWPPEDIYVVENTGAFNANKKGLLSLQNQFYLNYERLTKIFGVKVITSPTLLTFAQLQNFYISTALDKNWPQFFWSHMDICVVPPEDGEKHETLYARCVNAVREQNAKVAAGTHSDKPYKWAMRFFAYDHLTLVNTAGYQSIGGWDSMIPYYMTDCDMHNRVAMANLTVEESRQANVFDVATTLPDLRRLFRRVPKEGVQYDEAAFNTPLADLVADKRNSGEYKNLTGTLHVMDRSKQTGATRNNWQWRQVGGAGEAYYYSPEGFEKARELTIENGKKIYAEKWGHRDCNLQKAGLRSGDEWRVEHDWEEPKR